MIRRSFDVTERASQTESATDIRFLLVANKGESEKEFMPFSDLAKMVGQIKDQCSDEV